MSHLLTFPNSECLITFYSLSPNNNPEIPSDPQSPQSPQSPQWTDDEVVEVLDDPDGQTVRYVAPELFNGVFISLIVVSTICITLCFCCTGLFCCFLYHRKSNRSTKVHHSSTISRRNRSDAPPPPPPKKERKRARNRKHKLRRTSSSSIIINPISPISESPFNEGFDESIVRDSVIIIQREESPLHDEDCEISEMLPRFPSSRSVDLVQTPVSMERMHERNNSGSQSIGFSNITSFNPNPSIFSMPSAVDPSMISNEEVSSNLMQKLSDKFRSMTSISRRSRRKRTGSQTGSRSMETMYRQDSDNDVGCEVVSPRWCFVWLYILYILLHCNFYPLNHRCDTLMQCTFTSTDSKSRTSISLTQPGIDGNEDRESGDEMEQKEHSIPTNVTMSCPLTNPHKISLSADQLTSLQHGLAVQTDGIRIKLETTQRKRSSLRSTQSIPNFQARKYNALDQEEDNGSRSAVISLIQGYKTKRAPLSTDSLAAPYAKVGSKSSLPSLDHIHIALDGNEDSSSESHESMYNLLVKDEDTDGNDGYITSTPTNGKESEFEVKKEILHNRNMGVLQEEGIIGESDAE